VAREKDSTEVELAAIVKTARTSIRLRHSIAADKELNEKIPEIETAYWAAIAAGRKFKLESFQL
jgi:hypothetical protein